MSEFKPGSLYTVSIRAIFFENEATGSVVQLQIGEIVLFLKKDNGYYGYHYYFLYDNKIIWRQFNKSSYHWLKEIKC